MVTHVLACSAGTEQWYRSALRAATATATASAAAAAAVAESGGTGAAPSPYFFAAATTTPDCCSSEQCMPMPAPLTREGRVLLLAVPPHNGPDAQLVDALRLASVLPLQRLHNTQGKMDRHARLDQEEEWSEVVSALHARPATVISPAVPAHEQRLRTTGAACCGCWSYRERHGRNQSAVARV